MTPDPAAPPAEVKGPNQWIYAWNLLVIVLEGRPERWAKLGADWRVLFEPDLRDPLWHRVKVVIIAREPDSWSVPVLAQAMGITVEEMDALNVVGSEKQLLDLIDARMEVGWRNLIQLLFANNPEMRQRIGEYV